jgi:hypothetical protein
MHRWTHTSSSSTVTLSDSSSSSSSLAVFSWYHRKNDQLRANVGETGRHSWPASTSNLPHPRARRLCPTAPRMSSLTLLAHQPMRSWHGTRCNIPGNDHNECTVELKQLSRTEIEQRPWTDHRLKMWRWSFYGVCEWRDNFELWFAFQQWDGGSYLNKKLKKARIWMSSMPGSQRWYPLPANGWVEALQP